MFLEHGTTNMHVLLTVIYQAEVLRAADSLSCFLPLVLLKKCGEVGAALRDGRGSVCHSVPNVTLTPH